MDWWVKVMTIIILWPIPLPSLECVRRASCYNIHILFNFPATLWNWNPGEFGNRAKGLSGRCLIPKSPLHCPRHGQPTPGLVMLFKWRVFDVCRVDCLKYWVGQEKSSFGFAITSYGKTRTNFWASPVTGTVWSQGRSNEQYTTADPDFVVEFMEVHRGAVRTCQGLPPLICLAPGLRVSCSGKQGLQNRKENTS